MLTINTYSEAETAERIQTLRHQLGKDLAIVGHHYQHDDVIDFTDLRGDSLELARKVAAIDAANIVFCGVFFMAESAALLARNGQRVFLPDHAANCVMAQMAPADRLDAVMQRLNSNGRRIVPLAYVNTSLAIKAVVGHHGGAVCTSANAKTMLTWAMEQGDGVLFLPDKNLAQNTAKTLGISPDDQHIINIRQTGDNQGMPSIAQAANSGARLFMWPGCCAIHAKFNTRQIAAMREQYAGCHVIVHPECSPEVVNAADAAGSTSFIIAYAKKMPQGATLVIGTEINLVKRLAKEYAGRLNIIPLHNAACSHMAKITAPKLLHTLEAIANGTALDVSAPAHMIDDARASLVRMLDACS
ncbi:MAG: quinolinate synthase NadA [Pseudomonadota bacterium]